MKLLPFYLAFGGLVIVSVASASAGFRVTREALVSPADHPQVEVSLAAHPTDPDNLLMSVIGFSRDDTSHRNARAAATTFHSYDGGATWKESPIPEQAARGGYNARVLFVPDGTAWFTAITFKPHRGLLYRSDDGGRLWAPPIDYGGGGDYPTLAWTTGGRVLVGATNNNGFPPESSVLRTWVVPSLPHEGAISVRSDPATTGSWGLLNMNAITFADGTVFLPFLDMPGGDGPWFQGHALLAPDGTVKTVPKRTLPVVFGNHEKAGPGEVLPRKGFNGFKLGYAISPRTGRLFAVWGDRQHDPSRLWISSSSDRGESWTSPQLIDPAPQSDGCQYQCAVAVNRDGVVGVVWFDTRGHPGRAAYDVYFAASSDEGRTFTTPLKVSSQSSRPKPWTRGGFDSERHITGGDYIGLVADAAGRFHAAWPDARDGTQQMWSAQIEAPKAMQIVPQSEAEGPIKAQVMPVKEAATPAGQAELPLVVGYLGSDVSEKLELVAPGGAALMAQLFPPARELSRRTLALLQVAAVEAGGELRKDSAVEAFGAWHAIVDHPERASILVTMTVSGESTARPLPDPTAQAVTMQVAENALWILARTGDEHFLYRSSDGLNWDQIFRARAPFPWNRFAVRQGSVFLAGPTPAGTVHYVAARHFTVRAVLAPTVRFVVPDGYGERAGNYGTLAEIGMPRGTRAFRHQTALLSEAWPKTDVPVLLTGVAYRPKTHSRAKEPYKNTVGELIYTLARTSAPTSAFVSSDFSTNLGSGSAQVYHGSLSWSTDLSGGFDAKVNFQRPFLFDPSREGLVVDVRVPVGAEQQVYFDAVRFPTLPALRLLAGLDSTASESNDYSTPVLEFTAVLQPQAPRRPQIQLALSQPAEGVTLVALSDEAAWVWCRWTRVSGPGEVAIAAPTAKETRLTFTAPGTYRLRCEASDGRQTVARDFVVTAAP